MTKQNGTAQTQDQTARKRRAMKSILTTPLDELLESITISSRSLQNRSPQKLSPSKDSRAFYLSDLAFCLIQGMSEKYNIGPAAFLEIFLREKAETCLSKEEIARIETVAQAMTDRRQALIDDLIHAQEQPAS